MLTKIIEKIVEPNKIYVNSAFKLKIKAIRYMTCKEMKTITCKEAKKFSCGEVVGNDNS